MAIRRFFFFPPCQFKIYYKTRAREIRSDDDKFIFYVRAFRRGRQCGRAAGIAIIFLQLLLPTTFRYWFSSKSISNVLIFEIDEFFSRVKLFICRDKITRD